MTGVEVADASEQIRAAPPAQGVRPLWLRPLALAAIIGLHSLAFVTFKGAPALSPVDSVEVALVSLGESAENQTRVDAIAPSEPEPSPPASAPPDHAPPPLLAAPNAPPLPLPATPKPPAEPPRDKPAEPKHKPAELAPTRQPPQAERQEARRGAHNGAASGGLSHASYAALLSAEINRRRFYPSAARAVGATGDVGVSFTVGPSGRVVSHAITRSSGDPTLDSAAGAILAAIHAPPPPGGSFTANTSIRFHLN